MINPYDGAKEATYDAEELGEHFRRQIDYAEQEKRIAIAKAEAYFAGFSEAIHSIASIMGASNYRVKKEEKA